MFRGFLTCFSGWLFYRRACLGGGGLEKDGTPCGRRYEFATERLSEARLEPPLVGFEGPAVARLPALGAPLRPSGSLRFFPARLGLLLGVPRTVVTGMVVRPYPFARWHRGHPSESDLWTPGSGRGPRGQSPSMGLF